MEQQDREELGKLSVFASGGSTDIKADFKAFLRTWAYFTNGNDKTMSMALKLGRSGATQDHSTNPPNILPPIHEATFQHFFTSLEGREGPNPKSDLVTAPIIDCVKTTFEKDTAKAARAAANKRKADKKRAAEESKLTDENAQHRPKEKNKTNELEDDKLTTDEDTERSRKKKRKSASGSKVANDAARNEAAGVVAPDAELGAPTGAAGVGGTTSGKGAGYTSQLGIASKFAKYHANIQSRLAVAKADLEEAKTAFEDCSSDNHNDNDDDDDDGDGNEVSLLFLYRDTCRKLLKQPNQQLSAYLLVFKRVHLVIPTARKTYSRLPMIIMTNMMMKIMMWVIR
jgi:hypothetical protein